MRPQAAELVRQVAARVPVAIASGAARLEIETVLEASGLRDLFEVLVCLEDVASGKPDPERLPGGARTAEQRRARADRAADVLVFEDSEQGLKAAIAAGMRCVHGGRHRVGGAPDGRSRYCECLGLVYTSR